MYANSLSFQQHFISLCNHYYLQHALLLVIFFLLLYIYNFICSLVCLNCQCSAVFESWFMDNHDLCKFNESLVSNNNNMLCPLHFLISPPQTWGGRGKKWGGTRTIFWLASLAKICRPLHFQRAICAHDDDDDDENYS